MTPSPRALIFDFDGLIADTETAIYQAWQELYASQGEELTREVYVQCVGGTFSSFDPMAELEQRLGHAVDWASLIPIKDERIRTLHLDLRTPLPGVRELLHAAQAVHLPCAVASSSSPGWVSSWLEKLQLRDYFTAVWCRGDDGCQPKPAPDLFFAAARSLRTAPADCLIFEDSLNGLRAAQAAGIPCCIIPSHITEVCDFSAATLQLKSLTEYHFSKP
jgi:putative hydrolase of the HAD superfamily